MWAGLVMSTDAREFAGKLDRSIKDESMRKDAVCYHAWRRD